MIDALIAKFMSEPFKILGGGGVFGVLVFVFNSWRTRARPRVRLIEHTYHVNGLSDVPVEVRVEIENVGREATSVERTVAMTCRSPRKGSIAVEFQVADEDRSLPPVAPRTFRVTGRPPASFIFSHFRVYTFKFTRGGSSKLRVLNSSGRTAGPLKFWFLKCLFLLTGALPHVEG